MRNRSNSGNHSQKNKSTWTWKSSSAMQCHLWKTSKQLPTDNDDNGIRRKQWQISGRHGWTCMKGRNQVDKIYPFGPLKLYFSLCWICFMKFSWRDRWQSIELHHPISSSNVICNITGELSCSCTFVFLIELWYLEFLLLHFQLGVMQSIQSKNFLWMGIS